MPGRNDSFLSADVTREVEIDGMKFHVTARRLGDGWFGAWSCCHCHRRGVNGVIYTTAKAAIELTVVNLAPHGCGNANPQDLAEYAAGSAAI
jgi:hypothetical protein